MPATPQRIRAASASISRSAVGLIPGILAAEHAQGIGHRQQKSDEQPGDQCHDVIAKCDPQRQRQDQCQQKRSVQERLHGYELYRATAPRCGAAP